MSRPLQAKVLTLDGPCKVKASTWGGCIEAPSTEGPRPLGFSHLNHSLRQPAKSAERWGDVLVRVRSPMPCCHTNLRSSDATDGATCNRLSHAGRAGGSGYGFLLVIILGLQPLPGGGSHCPLACTTRRSLLSNAGSKGRWRRRSSNLHRRCAVSRLLREASGLWTPNESAPQRPTPSTG